ncbi:MAG: hypothetical protein K6T65_06170 [Peptococcaceae bacterium]|nr:hypothetical protein [Peptococcaceae bacterium]
MAVIMKSFMYRNEPPEDNPGKKGVDVRRYYNTFYGVPLSRGGEVMRGASNCRTGPGARGP